MGVKFRAICTISSGLFVVHQASLAIRTLFWCCSEQPFSRLLDLLLGRLHAPPDVLRGGVTGEFHRVLDAVVLGLAIAAGQKPTLGGGLQATEPAAVSFVSSSFRAGSASAAAGHPRCGRCSRC